jgi:hypothetical protein
MSAGLDFAVINTGNPYTNIDPYIASATSSQQVIQSNQPPYPNGAYNTLGQAYLSPVVPGVLSTTKGQGAPLVLRYVRYNSTTAAACLAGPAAVYWTDETFTTVSGTFSEGLPAATGNLNSLAGVLLVNTTSYPGSLTGAQLTTALNGKYVWIATSGFVPGVEVPASTAIGDSLTGVSGSFLLFRTASGTAPISKRILQALTAVSGGLSDCLVDTDWTY